MADDTTADDDERAIELSTIQAIFPELIVDPESPFAASLDLPVTPTKSFPVVFPPLADGAAPVHSLPTPPPSDNAEDTHNKNTYTQPTAEIRYLSHLPALQLKLNLPQEYPSRSAPAVELTSLSPWVPKEKLGELKRRAQSLWEENGKSQVLYDYIDYLRQAAEDGFGIIPEGGSALVVPQDLEVALLDYDLSMKRQQFEQETFDCGICLEPKKGAICHRLLLCGHVFCVECLQDFYNNCITEGDVAQVKCLAPNCEKEVPFRLLQEKNKKKRIDRTLDPSELLQIPIDQENVQRYVTLKKKKRLESNKNTIYCPRKWCQGPARRGKERNDDEDSDYDDDDEIRTYDPNDNQDTLPPPSERLAICEDCDFSFCYVCKAGWHGEYQVCFPRRQFELTAEERASEEYLKAHSTACPTCNARCQKAMGCNHMICFQCKTHFCYLCSAWLSEDNPYVHFNTQWTPCFQRLWELEAGDGIREAGNNGVQRPAIVDLEEFNDIDPGFWAVDDDPAQPPPAPNPPAQAVNARRQEPLRAPGVRVNRRVQQGLARPAAPIEPNHNNGIQRFLEMAAADREDEWDSDELDSDDGF